MVRNGARMVLVVVVAGVPVAFPLAIPIVKEACYTHQVITTPTPMVAPVVMGFPCKVA
jgi:hypothetical protein